MATTITARAVGVPPRPSTPPSPHVFLSSSTPIPNKHLVHPGPQPEPAQGLPSPPETPSSSSDGTSPDQTRLHPPSRHLKLNDKPPFYALTAAALNEALEDAATRSLPDTNRVFPWLHGLTASNHMQLSMFKDSNANPVLGVPDCLRGVTIVKAGGDLNHAKLKGATAPSELLTPSKPGSGSDAPSDQDEPRFQDHETSQAFNIRNFKIQCCRMATCSDIIVYGDDATPRCEVEFTASLISQAQRVRCEDPGQPKQSGDRFSTFLLTDSFSKVERDHPNLVAISSQGILAEYAMDFPYQERREMAEFTKASEIANNVFLGPAPPELEPSELAVTEDCPYDICIEASDYARVPEAGILRHCELPTRQRGPAMVEFPSSGSFGARCSLRDDIESLVEMCHWIYRMANETGSAAGQDHMEVDDELSSTQGQPKARKILIHCSDGYTESSLLALAYFMYAECVPASEAWVRLHQERCRNFFAYPADKFFLEYAQRYVMYASPNRRPQATFPTTTPLWMKRMDGSLPSRVLPYLYLGNLNHATNPGLLKRLGITHILSVGEPIQWHEDPAASDEEAGVWPSENFLYVDKVQDNGIDPLTHEFERCLEFIRKAKATGGSTLVHCHRGVSRSATICIAEVMESMFLSFPRAYCFVRARRLNVIIQPHLLFAYELLKWEEHLCQKRGVPFRRECEWATIAREISILNKPYCKE